MRLALWSPMQADHLNSPINMIASPPSVYMWPVRALCVAVPERIVMLCSVTAEQLQCNGLRLQSVELSLCCCCCCC
jgi:hypothetical protein